MPMTDGDRMLQCYLRDRRLSGSDDHEPDLGGPTVPDFLVRYDGGEMLLEVKSFERSRLADRAAVAGRSRAFMMGSKEIYGPIRSAVREAARQLKPHQAAGRALVVVLANPKQLAIDLRDFIICGALYGDPAATFSVDPSTGAAREKPSIALTRDGKLTNDHPYISGVVVLHRADDHGVIAEAYESHAAAVEHTAEPLPLRLFDGPLDTRRSLRIR
jgi:hypothetical protein